jgi:asparagine synthase (glutamine-hydrolysing)
MCGFAGIVTSEREAVHGVDFQEAMSRMTAAVARRGPDDEGLWVDPDGHAILGFRRLAVLDPTPAGHQPMIAADAGSVIVLNGEIYNFASIRRELEARGVRFRSRSDTEVLLEALSLWGADVLPRLNGMFAFAWWNRRSRRLVLARDHAGIKPLYYFVSPSGKGVGFGSQFDQLLLTPWGEPGPVRQDVLHLYLRLHHIPAPYALLENTHQLGPGEMLEWHPGGSATPRTWWTLPRDPSPAGADDAVLEELPSTLDAAVRRHRVADVPLGVFLSGGIDSPLVTALARAQSGPGLAAFTLANPGWRDDEGPVAMNYARLLDVDFRRLDASNEDVVSATREVAAAQYEPFADFSILPTLLLSRFARQSVTVCLSGDGGDELFFGYERPLSLIRDGAAFRWPWVVRRALHAGGRLGLWPGRSDAIAHRSAGAYYFEVNSRFPAKELSCLAPGLPSMPESFRLYKCDSFRGRRDLGNFSRHAEFYGQLQRGLKKVDMASMHYGLEVRTPLLDRDVVDLSLRISPERCMQGATRKAPLREMLSRFVPADAIPRPKRGFAVPLGDWLRGPLRPVVEEGLFSGDLFPSGVFERRALRGFWERHLQGKADFKWAIWTLLSLQWWGRTRILKRPAL